MADLLIVDDDVDAADVLAVVMSSQGHDVRIGHDGVEGLRLARERAPEVALVDIDMPNLDGPGMAYEMLVHDLGLERIPLVLLSARPDVRRIADEVGTPYCLARPYSIREVTALVARALAERIAPKPQRTQDTHGNADGS
jgi:DNA-binding response OmpR family regulator